MSPSPAITTGSFVRSDHNDLGVGKLTRLIGDVAEVTYFHSIQDRELRTVPVTSLTPVGVLPLQARCYVHRGKEEWWIGRVGRPDNAPSRVGLGFYEVHFDDGRLLSCQACRENFWLRCSTPPDDPRLADPAEVLIRRGFDRPEYHRLRHPFAVSMVEQRANCRGMTGLLSGRVRLMSHQVEVVRRVLADPVQRYLLADEVGLGKTIEAGAVLRQFLLDTPRGRAIALVPALLVDQWEEELELRFAVRDLGGDRVRVCAVDAEVEAGVGGYEFVLIDEAQHVAALAAAADPADRARFARLAGLCHRARRLLLLSATPARHNERDFLAMLHLLDPALYRLEGVAEFEGRVARREAVGHLLLRLEAGTGRYVLGTVLDDLQQLRAAFPADHHLAHLTGELEVSLAAEVLDRTECDRLVASIRVHVSETYRLHRRMLRSRRGDVPLPGARAAAAVESPPRLPRRLLRDRDPRTVRAVDALEDWRVEAAGYLAGLPDPNPRRGELGEVFRLLIEAAGSWPGTLCYLVRARLRGRPDGRMHGDLTDAQWRAVCSPPFPGESGLLRRLLADVRRKPGRAATRVRVLARRLAALRDAAAPADPPRCVVFTGTWVACQAVTEHLVGALGQRAVEAYRGGMADTEVRRAIGRFRSGDDGCFVLVCDQAGEEGRNLQFAAEVFHFDLPLSPNRVEQRIGRVDRIGRTGPARSWVFVGPPPEDQGARTPFEAWYLVLSRGFGVFDASIAGLQFFVGDELPHLVDALLTDGTTGLLGRLGGLRERLAGELGAMGAHDVIDSIDVLGEDSTGITAGLDLLDAGHPGQQAALEGWVVDALRFTPNRAHGGAAEARYEPRFDPQPGTPDWYEYHTLVPLAWVFDRLARGLRPPPERAGRFHRRDVGELLRGYRRRCPRGVFDRAAAVGRSDVRLYRLGDPFLDATAEHMLWDDRGRVSAVWRETPGWVGQPQLAFRLDYHVMADVTAAQSELAAEGAGRFTPHSVRRLGDALFPPRAATVFVDREGQSIPEALYPLLAPLPGDAGSGFTDHDLSPPDRRQVLDRVCPPGDWADVCREARARSWGELLRHGDPPLRVVCAERADHAARVMGARVQQLELRLRGGGGGVDDMDVARERRLAALLPAGIRTPHGRLDSVGVIVLAGGPPA